MNTSAFDHRQTAHCESGALSALLRHDGLDLSEPMMFGLGAALNFAYIPFIKLGGLPLIAYRMPPGTIIRGVTRRLGISLKVQRFRDSQKGMERLSEHLSRQRPVGLQTSVYWLPYFPQDMRFHFNAHNIVAYGRQQQNFLISDPTFEHPVVSDYESLEKARFVRGALAPKGLLYYPDHIPERIDLRPAVLNALKVNQRILLGAPLPIIGIRGMRFVSRKLRRLGRQHDSHEQQNKLFIGHMVRMQEEIGTGGAGFRFMYASFLQEAASIADITELETVSAQLTHAGDEWRRFALYAAKMCKGRMAMDYDKLADQLLDCAELEKAAHLQIRELLAGRALGRVC